MGENCRNPRSRFLADHGLRLWFSSLPNEMKGGGGGGNCGIKDSPGGRPEGCARWSSMRRLKQGYTRYRPEVTEDTSGKFVARPDFLPYIFRTPVFGHFLPVTSTTRTLHLDWCSVCRNCQRK